MTRHGCRTAVAPAFRHSGITLTLDIPPPGVEAVVNRLWRLNDMLDTDATLFGLRHGFATAVLVNGLPDAWVAALLGHSNTPTLHRHYSYLTAQAKVMWEVVGGVRARSSAPGRWRVEARPA